MINNYGGRFTRVSGNRRTVIAGTGRYEPPYVVSNADLQRYYALSNGLFRAIGIEERRFLYWDPAEFEADDVPSLVPPSNDYYKGSQHIKKEDLDLIARGEAEPSDVVRILKKSPDTGMQYLAVERLLRKTGFNPEKIDKVYSVTSTPDSLVPNAAELISFYLGKRGPAFTCIRGCEGFVEVLKIADSEIRSGDYDTILVVGSNTASPYVRMPVLEQKRRYGNALVKPIQKDPNGHPDAINAALFGDGAAAALLIGENGNRERGISCWYEGTVGDRPLVTSIGGSARVPASEQSAREYLHGWKLRGEEIQGYAPELLADAVMEIFYNMGLSARDVSKLLLHPGNGKLFTRVGNILTERLGDDVRDLAPSILKTYGNLSNATIPTMMDLYWDEFSADSRPYLIGAIGGGAGYATCLVRN